MKNEATPQRLLMQWDKCLKRIPYYWDFIVLPSKEKETFGCCLESESRLYIQFEEIEKIISQLMQIYNKRNNEEISGESISILDVKLNTVYHNLVETGASSFLFAEYHTLCNCLEELKKVL